MIDPDEGTIYLNGKNTKEMNPVELRRRIGYVIQQIGLFPHMTVKDNISLIPHLERWDDLDITKRVEELLNLVALPPALFIHRYPSQLSGGQQQRVGLARALVMNPPLLLMDEPFGALDTLLRTQLQKEFLSIKRKLDKTIVFVTHDIDEGFTLGDRIAVMHNGKILQIGTPSELLFESSNDIVSRIVGSESKFKAIKFLKAKDVIVPLDEKYIFQKEMTCQEALEKMISTQIDVALIMDSKEEIRQINITDLLKIKDKEKSIISIGKKLDIVTPEEDLSSIVSLLKSSNQKIAVVISQNKINGLIMINSVLLNLV